MHHHTFACRLLASTLALAATSSSAWADEKAPVEPAATTPPAPTPDHHHNAHGPAGTHLTDEELAALAEAHAEAGEVISIDDQAPSESASSVRLSRTQLRERPHATPSDLLRQVPGLVVAQHAGGGKSDQYFLRGFDADHGTDVALFVDGVPVNLTSHGHGQGYADMHWIIPETIDEVAMHKGPYAARFGDFYTAGAIAMRTIDSVERPTVTLGLGSTMTGPVAGERLDRRLVGMASPDVGAGAALLAVEVANTDGPFVAAQAYRRTATLSKLALPIGAGELRLSANYYAASWNQSGQLPAAEVDAGRVDRFGSLDPSEGGASSRTSLGLGYQVRDDAGAEWNLSAYALNYRMRLFSNFTLFLRDEVNGDQIEQIDDRVMMGVGGTYARRVQHGDVQALVTAGVTARGDNVTTELWHTAVRRRLTDCWDNANPCNATSNQIRNLAAYVEADIALWNRLHVLPGVRYDHFTWDVDDNDVETALDPSRTTGGLAATAMASPKLSMLFHASRNFTLFANGGLGFHSNDARAAVAMRGQGALARATGGEVGVRTQLPDGFRASIDAWYLHLASEQVWVGDLGGTEPSDPTRRWGVDVEMSWALTPWLAIDANLALARSTVVANQGNGGALALAPRLMGGAGVVMRRGEASSLSVRLRGVGERPANDDGSLRAEGHLLVDAVASHRVSKHARVGVTVVNALNSAWREAQFADDSRVVPGGPVVEDVHFTPGVPLSATVDLELSY